MSVQPVTTGQSTTNIAFNASPLAVQLALNTMLDNVFNLPGATLATVSSTLQATGAVASLGTYYVTFEGALDGLDLPLLFPVATATGTTPLSNGTMNTTPAVSVVVPGTSEVQTISVTSDNGSLLVGGSTAGTFTLAFGGQTTAAIAVGATPAQVQTALSNLSSIGSNNVAVAGVIGDYTLTFENALAGTPLSAVSGSPSGGATVAVSPSYFNLVFNGQTTANLAYNDSAADVQNQLSALSGIGAGNVSVTSSTTTTDAVVVTGATSGTFQLIYGGQSAGIRRCNGRTSADGFERTE